MSRTVWRGFVGLLLLFHAVVYEVIAERSAHCNSHDI